MGIFGWSLPPGCTMAQINAQCDEGLCDMCCKTVDKCICPECPVCTSVGDPKCYKEHGLVCTAEQLAGQEELKRYNAEQDAYWEQYAKDHPEED